MGNFRIAEESVRPKVVSASYATMRRPGRVNYSKDNFCERTSVLMNLDGLIHFLEPRLPQPRPPDSNPGRFLPYEVLSLALYRFIESAGKSRWRATSLGDLCTVTKNRRPAARGRVKRLHAEQFLGIRKWFDGVSAFVPYIDDAGADEKFFYRKGFELKVLPRGRPWFQSLEHRAARTEHLARAVPGKGRATFE